jgi:dTDP-4-dehydrorhamnose reductase
MSSKKRIVVTGAAGYLGSCFTALKEVSDCEVLLLVREAGRVPDGGGRWGVLETGEGIGEQERVIRDFSPSVIFHFAALSSPVQCEQAQAEAEFGNVSLTEQVISLARTLNAKVVFTSTDLVFEGRAAPVGGYREKDAVSPGSVYANTKCEAERRLLESGVRVAVVRLALLLGGRYGEKTGPCGWMFDAFRNGTSLTLFEDEWRTPVSVEEAARALFYLGNSEHCGVFHLGGPERVSRVELGEMLADAFGYSRGLIQRRLRAESSSRPPRAENVALNSEKLQELLSFPLTPPTRVFDMLFKHSGKK